MQRWTRSKEEKWLVLCARPANSGEKGRDYKLVKVLPLFPTPSRSFDLSFPPPLPVYIPPREHVCVLFPPLCNVLSPPLSLSLLPSSLPSSHRSSSFLFVFFLFSFFFFRFFLLVFFRMVSLFAWQSTAAPSTPRHALSRKVRSRYHLLEFSHLLATSPWALHPPSSTGCSTTTTTTIWNREKMGPF